jgi:quinol monooxygenase YgiN
MEEDMSENVYWMLELEILPERKQDFEALMTEMVERTRNAEPGTINYEWSTSPDGRLCHLYERYSDSDAALKHLESFGANFAERFLAILKPIRFVVYGAPSEKVQQALADFTPVYMRTAGGFARRG